MYINQWILNQQLPEIWLVTLRCGPGAQLRSSSAGPVASGFRAVRGESGTGQHAPWTALSGIFGESVPGDETFDHLTIKNGSVEYGSILKWGFWSQEYEIYDIHLTRHHGKKGGLVILGAHTGVPNTPADFWRVQNPWLNTALVIGDHAKKNCRKLKSAAEIEVTWLLCSIFFGSYYNVSKLYSSACLWHLF